jgi:hypothetical protein
MIFKEGYMILDSAVKGIYLDTVQSKTMQAIPTDIIISGDYMIGIDGIGQLYITSTKQRTPIIKAAFSPKFCSAIVNPKSCFSISNYDKALFINITDGYLRRREFRLIEFDLKTFGYRIIDCGGNISCASYVDDFTKISYSKDGVTKIHNLNK